MDTQLQNTHSKETTVRNSLRNKPCEYKYAISWSLSEKEYGKINSEFKFPLSYWSV